MRQSRDQNQEVSLEALQRWKKKLPSHEDSLEVFCQRIISGDTLALSKVITWIESKHSKHREKALYILKQASRWPKKKTFRLGITGIPGVGKSTFIEVFGSYLIKKGKRVAVLSVDPSSHKTGGSILGDKTRMHTLARNENAFIRTSPSKSFLGGVTQSTYEAIALCECAGFDFVIVETVGVGQSEVQVEQLVDFFLLLQIPGAGDAIQTIKRGVMEIAHAILINKADGDNFRAAQEMKSKIASLVRVFQGFDSGWHTKVGTCSALTREGMDYFYDILQQYGDMMSKNDTFARHRKRQDVKWILDAIQWHYMQRMKYHDRFQKKVSEKVSQIEKGETDAIMALYDLINSMKYR